MEHLLFMGRALALAERGAGWVDPNPLVGAVIVRNGKIIGSGWHTCYAHPHAEREALADCRRRGNDPKGATIYVTLEPCCHTGKNPPCTEALIEAGIARVIMGAPDPNPLVAGGGIAALRAAGIEVVEGVMTAECEASNAAFLHFIQTGKPLVTLKYAMTLDGKIATRTGASRWITGETARARVHLDRARTAAIMVGVGTVLADDPSLTCRFGDFVSADNSAELTSIDPFCDAETIAYLAANPRKQPLRIVCDSHLRTPLSCKLVTSASEETPVLIATTVDDEAACAPYRAAGCEVVTLQADEQGQVNLSHLVDYLGQRRIDSLIIEGGAQLAYSALSAHIVNRVQTYVAPKAFGGASAPSPVGGLGVETPDEAHTFGAPRITQLGNDILLECEVF